MGLNIKGVIMDALSPIIKLIVGEVLKLFLRKFVAKEPDHAKVLLTSMYHLCCTGGIMF